MYLVGPNLPSVIATGLRIKAGGMFSSGFSYLSLPINIHTRPSNVPCPERAKETSAPKRDQQAGQLVEQIKPQKLVFTKINSKIFKVLLKTKPREHRLENDDCHAYINV